MSGKDKIEIKYEKLKLKIAFLGQRTADLEAIVKVLCKIHINHNACSQFLQEKQEDQELAEEAKRLRLEEIINRRKQKATK